MKKFFGFLKRFIKRLIALPFVLLVRGFLGLVSLALTILSIPAVREWLWKQFKSKTKEKIVDIEGKVKKKTKKKIQGE